MKYEPGKITREEIRDQLSSSGGVVNLLEFAITKLATHKNDLQRMMEIDSSDVPEESIDAFYQLMSETTILLMTGIDVVAALWEKAHQELLRLDKPDFVLKVKSELDAEALVALMDKLSKTDDPNANTVMLLLRDSGLEIMDNEEDDGEDDGND